MPKKQWIDKHLGETRTNNAGLKMTITNGTSNNLTVTFEDKSIVRHTDYNRFKNGSIRHPNNWIMTHINKKILNKNGIEMTITGGTPENLTVTFEDGSITKHKTSLAFHKKNITHPLYPSQRKSINSTEIGCITRKKIAYKTDTCHYYCTCNICNKNDIWNWKEIHEHNTLHGIPKEDLILIESD